MPGHGELFAAAHARRFDEDDVAAHRRPHQPHGDARPLDALLDFFFRAELRYTQEFAHHFRRHDHLFRFAFGDFARLLPRYGGDFALEVADARLARVAVNDLLQPLVGEVYLLVHFQAVLGSLLRDQVLVRNVQFLYTGEEKLHIAHKYLIPKQASEHGLKMDEQIHFTDEGLQEIIHSYTREAGVRNLEREIATITRKQARKIAEGKTEKMIVTPEVVREFLGVPKFRTEKEVEERVKRPGVAVGLVWTPVGGDIIFIEATRMRGGKQFTMTGHLGEVMQESMTAALTWTRANADRYGIDPDFFRKQDIHIHVPSGAVPKDGPSAGAAMVTALVSLLSGRPVKDRLAMTGEMTLSGVVLPIGGVKEKVLGAKRAGIKEVLLPADNEPNVVADLTPDILGDIKITYVHTLDEVLEHALQKEPVAQPLPPAPEPKAKRVGPESPRAIH